MIRLILFLVSEGLVAGTISAIVGDLFLRVVLGFHFEKRDYIKWIISAYGFLIARTLISNNGVSIIIYSLILIIMYFSMAEKILIELLLNHSNYNILFIKRFINRQLINKEKMTLLERTYTLMLLYVISFKEKDLSGNNLIADAILAENIPNKRAENRVYTELIKYSLDAERKQKYEENLLTLKEKGWF